jgi:hypothetical protein
MKKVIEGLGRYQVPTRYTREDWKGSTYASFSPYFRRRSALVEHIDSFMIELRNLAHLVPHQENLELLKWCLFLYRSVLREDRARTYAFMHNMFQHMVSSDARWMNLFHATAPIERGIAPQDLTFQLFEIIDGIAEGCLKPQFQILSAFAIRQADGKWPSDVSKMDFGALVAKFPAALKEEVPILLKDPDLGIPVNQWRNIGAHRSYQLVGPQTIEVTYGKGAIHTRRFGIRRLSRASSWIIRLYRTLRLANSIIYTEHMREIVALGALDVQRPFSASLTSTAHDLSTVGFETIGWQERKQEGLLILGDRLGRDKKDAFLHASQQLVRLAIGVLADVSTRTRIKKVSIGLQLPDGSRYATATVSVEAANAFSLRRIDLDGYMDNIEWRVGK